MALSKAGMSYGVEDIVGDRKNRSSGSAGKRYNWQTSLSLGGVTGLALVTSSAYHVA